MNKSDLLTKLSDYFWSSDYRTTTEAFDEFFEHRDKLKSKDLDQDYHIVVGGRKKDDSTSMHFGPYYVRSSKGPKAVLDELFEEDWQIDKYAKT